MLLSIGKFSKETGISVSTLRLWHKEGKLVPHKVSDTGFRYYTREQVLNYLNKTEVLENEKNTLLYARVSTSSQSNDLEKQVDNLKSYAYAKGYKFNIITDIGSGINYTKSGLQELINLVCSKKVDKIVILYKDRLASFGFEIIEQICKIHDVEIEIIDNSSLSKEEELTNDLIHIITVFSNRLYGSRSKKTKELIDKVKQK